MFNTHQNVLCMLTTIMATDEDKKKAELRRKVEHQVACEERAFRIVEKLIDNPVSLQYFTESLQYITPSHYHDIVEERAVSKLCGYPMCPQPLGNVPKQKYFISTKSNRVYDIETRKNFCSAICYNASVHVEKQISTEPIWTRQGKSFKQIDLLPLDTTRGKVGDAVIISKYEEMKKEIEKLEKVDKFEEELKSRQKLKSPDSITNDTNSDSEAMYKDIEKTMNEMKIETKGNSSKIAKSADSVHKESDKGDVDLTKIGQVTKDYVKVEVAMGACVSEKLLEHKTEVNTGRNLHVGTPDEISEEFSSASYSKPNGKRKSHIKPKQKQDNCQPETEAKGCTEQKSSLSKTEYLMQLLNRKKSLLAKMADIQDTCMIKEASSEKSEVPNPISYNSNINVKKVQEEVKGVERTVTDSTVSASLEDSNTNTTNSKEDSIVELIGITESDSKIKVINEKPESEHSSLTLCQQNSNEPSKIECADLDKKTDNVANKSKRKSKHTENCHSVAMTLDIVGRIFQTWLTGKSLEYLREGQEEESEAGLMGPLSAEREEFQRQYKALVQKVDAQEKEFDEELLGEVQMSEGACSGPTAPMPDYRHLQHEAQLQRLRVREFLKGTFTYKADSLQQDKQEVEKPSIRLPTVDRYDQMVIRQKIVLDRLSKVLPELLAPLNLLLQEVYPEVKDFIITCNLTSENITCKPVEWLLASLILLKLLSMKMGKIQKAFSTSRAQTYIGTLLSGIGASLPDLDTIVTQLALHPGTLT